MSIDATAMRDNIVTACTSSRPTVDTATIRGYLLVEVHGPDGALKQSLETHNLVTEVGDTYFGERGAGLAGAPAVTTGMQLGTGVTAASKTGAGAAIVTLVASSLVAHGTPTSSLAAGKRRIQYVTTWAAGVATANGIAEVVLTNQATATQTAAPASATISRALLSPTVNKAAGDSLTITWNIEIQGT